MPLDLSLNYLLRFLANNSTASIEDENDFGKINLGPDNLDKEHRHSEFLSLLIIDLIIFMGLTFTSYSSSQKLSSRSKAQTATASEDFKPKFIKGLVYANGSTIFIIFHL